MIDEDSLFEELPILALSNGENPVFMIGRSQVNVSERPNFVVPISDLDEETEAPLDRLQSPRSGVESKIRGTLVIKFISEQKQDGVLLNEATAMQMIEHLATQRDLPYSALAPLEAAIFVHEHTPKVICHGVLYDHKHKDISDFKPFISQLKWPYIMTNYIKGINLLQAYPNDPAHDLNCMTGAAKFVGQFLRNLHQFEVPVANRAQTNPLYANGWSDYEAWLVRRRRKVAHPRPNSRKIQVQPEMIPQIDEYIPKDPRALFQSYCEKHNIHRPRLLHWDLNEEHILVEDQESNPKFSVIDFGDCRLGDPQYEWVALHVSGLRCNKKLLTVALLEYFQCESFDELTEKVGGWKHFAHTMMCYTLLHDQAAISTAYWKRPYLKKMKTLAALADEIWNLSIEQMPDTPASKHSNQEFRNAKLDS